MAALMAALALATIPHMTMLPEVVEASDVIVAGRVRSQLGREIAPFTVPERSPWRCRAVSKATWPRGAC